MSEDRKGYFELMFGVLRRPGEYLGHVGEGDLVRGVLVALLMAALAGVSTSVYMSKIPLEVLVPQLGEVGVDVGDVGASMGLLSGVGAAVTILLGWTLSTVVMHGMSNLAGGRGSLKRFFAMHGFASVPYAVNYALRTVDAYVSSSQALVAYYTASREVGPKILRAVLDTNMVTVFGAAGLFYATYALAENYQIDRRRASLIALVPVLLYVFLNFLSPT